MRILKTFLAMISFTWLASISFMSNGFAHADSSGNPGSAETTFSPIENEDSLPSAYDRLEVKQSQSVQISPEEMAAANRAAAEGLQGQLDASDPNAREAIAKALRNLETQKADAINQAE